MLSHKFYYKEICGFIIYVQTVYLLSDIDVLHVDMFQIW